MRRELLLLILLVLLATAGVFLTRALASRDRMLNARDAAAWYTIAQQQLQDQRIEQAVSALRHATVKDRANRRYATALARALAAAGQTGEARQLLLKLREAAPEDPEINAQLARVAARRQDTSEAVRYYRSAIYGVWASDQGAAQRSLRLELIRFLLGLGRRRDAVAELLALSAGLSDEAAARVEAGQLFQEAGDPKDALDQFGRALRLDPKNRDALAGAGEAAFDLGDYAGAVRYFRRVPQLSDRAADMSRVASLVLGNDPRAPRLTLQERRARLIAGVNQALQRLGECLAREEDAIGPGPTRAGLEAMRAELQGLQPTLRARTLADSPEAIDLGIDLVYRAEEAASEPCGDPGKMDRAWLLIGQRYGSQER